MRADTSMPEPSVGPKSTPKVSRGAPGNSRNLLPASSFTANPPSSTRKSSGTLPNSAFSKLFSKMIFFSAAAAGEHWVQNEIPLKTLHRKNSFSWLLISQSLQQIPTQGQTSRQPG